MFVIIGEVTRADKRMTFWELSCYIQIWFTRTPGFKYWITFAWDFSVGCGLDFVNTAWSLHVVILLLCCIIHYVCMTAS